MTDGLQYFSRRVPRAARPDGTRDDRSFIVKNASHLRLTYQLFVLTMQAQTEGTGLVIVVSSPPRTSTSSSPSSTPCVPRPRSPE